MSLFTPNITTVDIPAPDYDGHLPTVHILHGIHRDNPNTGPGNWAKYFTDRGFPVRIWDYGYVYALNARFFINPHVVDALINDIDDDDILLGHSNGCTIIADITDEIPYVVGGVILLNPALNKNRRISCDVPWVHVYCNDGDIAVTAGKWWRRVDPISWIVRHPYGEQGRYGPSFYDSRYSIFKGEKPPEGLSIVDGHSHINNKETLKLWGPFGVQEVLSELK